MLKDMLWGCVMEFTGSWDRYIPLMKFAYNNQALARHHVKLYMDEDVELRYVGQS